MTCSSCLCVKLLGEKLARLDSERELLARLVDLMGEYPQATCADALDVYEAWRRERDRD